MPDISRRRLLVASASAATAMCSGLGASPRTDEYSKFNGGRSQLQSWDLSLAGDFPFINLMKCATGWAFMDNQGEPDPSQLDADGYPSKIVHGGVKCITNIFPPSSRSGRYVLTWTGNGKLVVAVPNSGTVSPATGFTNSALSSRSGSGRFEFTTTSRDALVIGIAEIGSPRIGNVQLFLKEDEPALN